MLLSLKAAGLPVGKYITYTAANDPNHLLGRPGQYTSKVGFHDNRVPATKDFAIDGGGSVEAFSSRSDAERRFKYVEAIAKSPLFSEYDYLEGKVLLRVSHILTPKQAAAYERAFRKLV